MDNFMANENLKRWLQNLQLRDILLQVTGVCKSARTSYTLKPAGIDPDGCIAYDLHVERFLELIRPLEKIKIDFTIPKTGEISQKNNREVVK